MAKKIARLILTLAGAAAGVGVVMAANGVLESLGHLSIYESMYTWGWALTYAAGGIVFAIIFYIFSPRLIDLFAALINTVETRLGEMAIEEVFLCVMGLIVGLFVAFLASTLTSGIRPAWIGFIIDVLLYLTFGYLGWSVVSRHRGEVRRLARGRPRADRSARQRAQAPGGAYAGLARPKLLDTSVIIDGRIADICGTGVIEGTLIVPAFVLSELQHIADSSDSLKRSRGRRGLDIIKAMQESGPVPVTVVNTDYRDVPEVDSKLIKLAAEMNGAVVTNDYNLNKVASVRGVPVLNINDLANAVKSTALPGEEMRLAIVREGKEQGQGVGYLEDGTMIVVEGGRKFMGETVDAVVTSALQTSAGRMIFARLRQPRPGAPGPEA